MIDVPAQISALNLLLKNKLASDPPTDFEREIATAMRTVKHAVLLLRDALQADVKPAPHPATRLTRQGGEPYKGGRHDPRRQDSARQDIAAAVLLGIAAELLPKSQRLKVAIKATEAQHREDGRRAVGKSEIDDRSELIMMARLMIKSEGNKAPTSAASEVALKANNKGNSHKSTTKRLYRKYSKQSQLYDALAAALMRQEAIAEARRVLNMRDESQVDAFCRGNETLTGLVETIKENAEAARVVDSLSGTRKQQNKSPDKVKNPA